MFGPRVKGLGHGHSARCCQAKPRRSFSGWPGHWAPLDRENSFVSGGAKNVITSTTQKNPICCCCCPARWALAPCSGTHRGDYAWLCRMCSSHACCLPPLGHPEGEVPNSCSGKKDSAAGRERCKTYTTGARSVVKSLAAGCVSCLGSYAGFFHVCSARCRHLNSCWKETGVFKASCDFEICWFICIPTCGT